MSLLPAVRSSPPDEDVGILGREHVGHLGEDQEVLRQKAQAPAHKPPPCCEL